MSHGPLGGLLQRFQVIADVEGSGASGADGLGRVGGDMLTAAGALEVADGGHADSIQAENQPAKSNRKNRGLSGKWLILRVLGEGINAGANTQPGITRA